MRFGSPFSGIGGLDLGLERAGMECAWQVEIDESCRRVLARHWPDVPRWDDATTFPPHPDANGGGRMDAQPQEFASEGRLAALGDFGSVDLICGGFPCQPVSLAGKRRGQDDERWLWPEFARIVRLLRPRYVLVENVPGLLARGMGDVLADLAACGYDAEWDCIPAAAVGAPHLRYRVFIVAYAQGYLRRASGDARRSAPDGRRTSLADAERSERRAEAEGRDESDGHDTGREEASGRSGTSRGSRREGAVAYASGAVPVTTSEGRRPARAVFPGGSQGAGSLGFAARSDWWTTEPDVGRVAHGVPARVDRLRGLGNAVVPQVAEWIGRRLMETA